MKNWVNLVWGANSPWQNFFAVAVMAFAAIAAGGTALTLLGATGLLSEHVAAWVQAIGSVVAILAAVIFINLEHEKAKMRQKEADQEDEIRLLKALRTELEVEWDQYLHLAGWSLETEDEVLEFKGKWLVHPSPFPIYRSNASRISLVRSESLRKALIKAYANFERLLITIQANNIQIDEVTGFNMHIAQNVPHAKELQKQSADRLKVLGKLIANAHRRTSGAVTSATSEIDAFIRAAEQPVEASNARDDI